MRFAEEFSKKLGQFSEKVTNRGPFLHLTAELKRTSWLEWTPNHLAIPLSALNKSHRWCEKFSLQSGLELMTIRIIDEVLTNWTTEAFMVCLIFISLKKNYFGITCWVIEVWLCGSEPTLIRSFALVQQLSVWKGPRSKFHFTNRG